MFKRLFGGKVSDSAGLERKEPTFEKAGTPPTAGVLAQEAKNILKGFLANGYTDERGIHLESVLSATAALAGYAALQAALTMIRDENSEAKEFPQAHKIETASGEVFLMVELANQLVARGEGLERLSILTLVSSGGLRAGAKRLPNMVEIFKRNAQFIGSADYPPLTVPAQHRPPENARVALRRWWPMVVKVFSTDPLRGLHPINWVFALGNLAGEWIETGKNVLDPEIAMQLAMETAVATSKLTGMPVSE